ncbi:MAG: DsrE/DsrF/DrsH-like family protein [Archaeoglobaceae archaeon]
MQAASVIASVASSFGEVMVFATMDGLMAFKKDVVKAKAWKKGELGKGMLSANVPLFTETLRQAKETGNLKIYACGMVMDMLGLKKEAFVERCEFRKRCAGVGKKSWT